MPTIIERAVAQYLEETGANVSPPTSKRNALRDLTVTEKKRQVGDAALRFFDAATHPSYSKRFRRDSRHKRKTDFNGGEIITYHGPFALENRTVAGVDLTVAKQARVYDYRNGATGEGNPEIHIEACFAHGLITDPDIHIPGTYILSDIEVKREALEDTQIKVRKKGDRYSASKPLVDPNDSAWTEVLGDLRLATTYINTGVVAMSRWIDANLISVS